MLPFRAGSDASTCWCSPTTPTFILGPSGFALDAQPIFKPWRHHRASRRRLNTPWPYWHGSEGGIARINRLTLRNFRGVTSAEVTFPSEGVTIIEGDNEAGKSSLAEALTMVLEVRDDSRKQGVMAVKPVHRDAGPEVEVDLSRAPPGSSIPSDGFREALDHAHGDRTGVENS